MHAAGHEPTPCILWSLLRLLTLSPLSPLHPRPCKQVFCAYGRSHMYKGLDLVFMVTVVLVFAQNCGQAVCPRIASAVLWSPLLVAASLLVGPFWFTPFFFRLRLVRAHHHHHARAALCCAACGWSGPAGVHCSHQHWTQRARTVHCDLYVGLDWTPWAVRGDACPCMHTSSLT